MLTKLLHSHHRLNIYLKYLFALLLVVFYFVFLFRESLNAFQTIQTTTNNNLKGKQNYEEKSTRIIAKQKRNRILTYSNITTINPVYEYSEELQSAIEKDLAARKAHMWEVCVRENITGVYPPNAWEFFLSQGHNLIWCNVFKAASSTWMYYFNILAGYDIKYLQRTKTSPLELARKMFPRPKLYELIDALPNAVSFLTVRDPFERLLSAYRDKLEGCHNKYYKVLAKQIIKNFRKKKIDTHEDEQNKKQKQQFKQQIKQQQQQQQQFHNHHHHHYTTGGPTFKEFLLFLIQTYKNGKKFDEHWTPIYRFCTPCSINFTLIVKVETFQRDTEYIIRQAGLEPLLLGKLPKNRMKKISNQASDNSARLINRYFSQIDRNILDEIVKIYRLDFDLFGYNLTKYYEIVQSPSPPPPPKKTKNNVLNLTTTSTVNTVISSIRTF